MRLEAAFPFGSPSGRPSPGHSQVCLLWPSLPVITGEIQATIPSAPFAKCILPTSGSWSFCLRTPVPSCSYRLCVNNHLINTEPVFAWKTPLQPYVALDPWLFWLHVPLLFSPTSFLLCLLLQDSNPIFLGWDLNLGNLIVSAIALMEIMTQKL